jgi:hypothetical protein
MLLVDGGGCVQFAASQVERSPLSLGIPWRIDLGKVAYGRFALPAGSSAIWGYAWFGGNAQAGRSAILLVARGMTSEENGQ